MWKVEKYPALVFPVDKVDVEKDGETVGYKPRHEKDRYNWVLGERWTRRIQGCPYQFTAYLSEGDMKMGMSFEILKQEAASLFVDYIEDGP